MSIVQFTEYLKLVESLCWEFNSKIDFGNFGRHFAESERIHAILLDVEREFSCFTRLGDTVES